MKRGEIWTVSGGPDYAGKPRPAIILQDDAFDATASITVCPLTTHQVDAPLIRLILEPSERNGLRSASHAVIDKITTVSKKKLEHRVGKLSDEDIVRVNRAIVVFPGPCWSGNSLSVGWVRPTRHQLSAVEWHAADRPTVECGVRNSGTNELRVVCAQSTIEVLAR